MVIDSTRAIIYTTKISLSASIATTINLFLSIISTFLVFNKVSAVM